MSTESSEWDLVRQAQQNDAAALAALFSKHRARLRNMVRLHLNPRLAGRVDASDVVQEAYLEASRVLKDYLANPQVPFFLWLRHLTGQKVIEAHRRHLGARKRGAEREVPLHRGGMPGANSESMAIELIGRVATPSILSMKAEMKTRLQQILDDMDDMDREVLMLRHFEQLSNAETAEVLGIEKSAASKRYIRALERIQETMGGMESQF
jgi:RNA polymerase sigma-70 factor (ECF subfamily)